MSTDRTGEKILDAALATVLDYGIRRSTVEEVARRARVSHMTVYRRWPTKNALLTAVLRREVQDMFARIDEEVSALDSPAERLVAGFTGIYWHVYSNPMFKRALETDPEAVLPILTSGAGGTMDIATHYLAGHISRGAVASGMDIDDPYGAAEIFVRLTHSLLLAPRAQDPLDTREAAEAYARRYILPLARTVLTPA